MCISRRADGPVLTLAVCRHRGWEWRQTSLLLLLLLRGISISPW